MRSHVIGVLSWPWRGLSTNDVLALATGGTFARASAGLYYTAAPNTGGSAFLASASTDVRRITNRGDGLGWCLLMERSATNTLTRSRELDNAPWAAGGSGSSLTAGDANGPDGSSSTADLLHAPSTYSTYQGPWSPTNGQSWVFSFWAKRHAGAGSDECHFCVEDGSPDGTYINDPISETWGRHDAIRVIAASGSVYLVPGEGRTKAGLTARTLDYDVDLVQWEQGFYPTSPIITTSATVTRSQDTLSYVSGAFPVDFLTNGFKVIFAPDASSAEIVNATEDWRLIQVGANDFLRIRYVLAAGCRVELVIGGAVIASTVVTFSRGQALTLTAKPSAGKLVVSGATTGDGTYTGSGTAWPSATTLYVAGDNAGGHPATGRFCDARGGYSAPCIVGAPIV